MRAASHDFRSATPSPESAAIMKVASNLALSLAACAEVSKTCFATRSILLRMSALGARTSESFVRMASASSSRPLRASISRPTRSASCAPLQALVTMARSSRRRGAKMPGVSTKMICEEPSAAMPRISARVVCTLRETIDTLEPTSALSSVDLPALGAPIKATKPQRVSPAASGIRFVQLDADPFQHGGGGGLFGGPLGKTETLGGRAVGQRHRDPEFRVVMRAGARQFAVVRRRQPARLRPLLQHGLGIAQRAQRLGHALFPEARHQFFRR